MINMIICHTTIGHYSIQEHVDDASEIGYGFSTLPKFQVEIKVKVELNWKLNVAERAAYLQFLKDFKELWKIIPASSLVYLIDILDLEVQLGSMFLYKWGGSILR